MVINTLRYTLPLIPVHSTVTEFTKRCGLLPLKDLTIPNYLQNSFNRDGVRFRVSEKLKPFMCFDYVTVYHSKIKSEEFNVKKVARKSIITNVDIKKGEIFSTYNITIKRPGIGMSPKKFFKLLNKKAKKNYKKNQFIKE